MNIVLGTWGLVTKPGPFRGAYVPLSAATIDAIYTTAWHVGIRNVDVCPMYGDSIEQLGRWQRGSGKRFRILAKLGRIVAGETFHTSCDANAIRAELDDLRDWLGEVEAVLLKDPAEEDLRQRTVSAALRRIAQVENVRVGVATHRLGALPTTPPVVGAIAEVEYNGIVAPVVQQRIAAARAAGWVMLGIQPLAYGILSLAYRDPSAFSPADWRARIPHEVFYALRAAAVAFHAGPQVPPGPTPAIRALTFCFAQPDLDAVVVGPKSVSQLEDVVAAYVAAQAFARPSASSGERRV